MIPFGGGKYGGGWPVHLSALARSGAVAQRETCLSSVGSSRGFPSESFVHYPTKNAGNQIGVGMQPGIIFAFVCDMFGNERKILVNFVYVVAILRNSIQYVEPKSLVVLKIVFKYGFEFAKR